MKLRELLETIGEDVRIRIFAGCITIFNGKKSNTSEKEWNLTVLPHMNSRVLNFREMNGSMNILI